MTLWTNKIILTDIWCKFSSERSSRYVLVSQILIMAWVGWFVNQKTQFVATIQKVCLLDVKP